MLYHQFCRFRQMVLEVLTKHISINRVMKRVLELQGMHRERGLQCGLNKSDHYDEQVTSKCKKVCTDVESKLSNKIVYP